MFNSKNAKRSLLMSALALVLCVSMLVGSTFAWFTDTATTSVNKIQSGTLDIELLMYDGTSWVNAEGQTLNFIAKDSNQNILWEPGCTYELPQLKVVNKGNLELKYQIHITGIEGNAKLLEVIDFTIEGEDALTGTLAPQAETAAITLIGHMAEEADNDYMGLTMEAISITVVATQMTAENDTYGPDYDEDAWHPAMKVYNANDLQAALNNGETNIVVMDDIDLTESIVIPAAASTFALRSAPATVINLNGKTIIGTVGRDADNNRIHTLVNNGTLTIKNGTVKSAGYDGGSAIYNNAGATVTIENVVLYGAPQSDPVYEAGVSKPFPSYAVNNYGNAVVNGATIKSYHGAIATGGNGVTVINDADIDVGLGQSTGITSYLIYSYEDAQVTVNDGKFAFTKQEVYVNGGNTFCELGTNPILINGGNYTGTSFSTGEGREYIIKGGTFDKDPSAYVAAGYAAEKNAEGNYVVLFPQSSFESLIDGAQAGETVEIPAGTYTFPASKLEEGMTLHCAPGTVFEGKTSLNINGATVAGATFTNDNDYLVNSTTINGTFKDCVFTNSDGLRYCYAGETVVFENCVFDTDFYGVHFDGGANDVVFKNCTFSGFNTFGSAVTKLTMEGCTFEYNGKGGYNGVNLWGNTDMTDCTFIFDGTAGYEWVDLCGDNQTVTFTNCVVTDGVNETPIANVVGNYGTGNTITIDGVYQVATQDALDAIAGSAPTTSINLAAGDYTMPDSGLNGKTMTISGTKDTVIDVSNIDARNQFVTGATLTFDGVTLEFGTVNYMGFANTANLVYKNCHIKGLQFLFGNNVSFENCTFDSLGAEHSVWTYGAVNVSFTECDFTYADRCINCYSDNDVSGGKQTVTFTDCTFNTENTTSEGAVEINSHFFSVGIEVNMNGCTAPAYGEMAYVSPWDSDNGAKTTVNIQ